MEKIRVLIIQDKSGNLHAYNANNESIWLDIIEEAFHKKVLKPEDATKVYKLIFNYHLDEAIDFICHHTNVMHPLNLLEVENKWETGRLTTLPENNIVTVKIL